MWQEFRTRVPGKFVLAGEHAVLRGATAVALPHPEFALELSFKPAREGRLEVEPSHAEPVIRDLLDMIRDRSEQLDQSFPSPAGRLRLESSIPAGAGLGSSAALCVAITRWMREPLRLPEEDLFEFARSLEDRFHGRSSGMDIAAVLAGQPISYTRERGATPLGVRKLPRFTFHDLKKRAKTSDCIIRVEDLQERNPLLAMKTDERMSGASRAVMEGLVQYDRAADPEARRSALAILTQGIKQANECYYVWELMPGEGRRQEEELLRQGALATKLTGAGMGGFLVALWPDEQ